MGRFVQFCFRASLVILLVFVLFTGLRVVDQTNRIIMMVDETSFFDYTSINSKQAEVMFCGNRYLVDIDRIKSNYNYIKDYTVVRVNHFKDYIYEKGVLLTKLID